MHKLSPNNVPVGKLRLDKWLFYSRLVKSRSLAAALANSGKVRINKQKIDKASYLIKQDDVLMISFQRHIKIVKIIALAERRGSAIEGQKLYQDLTPIESLEEKITRKALQNPTQHGARPTKKHRRKLDQLHNKFE